jgi:negative regulator of sigma E activity
MRRLDDTPIDPEVAACLDAIDATLAGDPVDPRHAELAELALLLADERPRPRPVFCANLDARVARRFAAAPSRVPGSASAAPATSRPTNWWRPLGGVLAAACAALLVVVGVSNLGGGASSSSSASSSSTPAAVAGPSSAAPGSAAGRSSSSAASSASSGAAQRPLGARSTQNLAPATASASSSGGEALTLPPNSRKVVQSAQLDLTTTPRRIEQVAQEVFNVVGEANGIVDHSAVTQTGGSDGSADFALRVPSGNLSQTLARLSALRGAQVVSRTDNSQDVNSQYVSAHRQLADDQALRTGLLKQLAAAVTQQQIDSLKAQLRNAEASISSDQAAVRQLNSQIDYSRVAVTIDAGTPPTPVIHHSARGFTLGHATHVAGRVLVVAAGVGLIALAALLPVALLVALVAWVMFALRRRRREQALDLA